MSDQPRLWLHLTDEELREIGRVAQLWAHFEGLLVHTITHLLGLDPQRGSLVGMAQGTKLNLDLIDALALGLKDPAAIKALQKFVTRASKLQSKRNDIVHLVWRRKTAATLWPVGLKVRGKIKSPRGEVMAADFAKVSDEISCLAGEMLAFLIDRRIVPPLDQPTRAPGPSRPS